MKCSICKAESEVKTYDVYYKEDRHDVVENICSCCADKIESNVDAMEERK